MNFLGKNSLLIDEIAPQGKVESSLGLERDFTQVGVSELLEKS